MVAAWIPHIWQEVNWEVITLCGDENIPEPNHRTALILNLQRATACGNANARDASPLAQPDELMLLLTKFHQGTQASGQAFDAHSRRTAWTGMAEVVKNYPKCIIAGALATDEVQLQQRMKELQPANYSRWHGQSEAVHVQSIFFVSRIKIKIAFSDFNVN